MTESHLNPSFRTMPYRELGATSRRVSKLGLGLAALGRPSYLTINHGVDLQGSTSVEQMRDRCHQVLDRAWEAGVCYFDAARSYGLSEQFLMDWVTSRNIPAHLITIGSKWGYVYTGNWQIHAPTMR